jgi:hypothetical protein
MTASQGWLVVKHDVIIFTVADWQRPNDQTAGSIDRISDRDGGIDEPTDRAAEPPDAPLGCAARSITSRPDHRFCHASRRSHIGAAGSTGSPFLGLPLDGAPRSRFRWIA